MILRYDEVISEKANKTSLIDVEKKAYEKYAKKDDVNETLSDHEGRISKMLNELQELDSTVKW